MGYKCPICHDEHTLNQGYENSKNNSLSIYCENCGRFVDTGVFSLRHMPWFFGVINMNYKIGDVVVKKTNRLHGSKYIFMGTTKDTSIKIVKDVLSVMGENAEIGMYIFKPVKITAYTTGEYLTEVIFASTELFESEV